MIQKIAAVFATALGILAALAPPARASVIYTVQNPAAPPHPFILFVYDSPTFITTDTIVPVEDLTFANPANTITSVEFIPASSTHPGTSEIDVLQSGASDQFRYYPDGTFTQYGVTPGDSNSFGYPNSELSVAAPEPATIGLFATGLLAIAALRRSAKARG